MLDAWLDAVVMVQVGPSLCAGVVLAEDPTDRASTGPERTVATAYHCVAAGMRPLVSFRDGGAAVGRVVARDPAHDLALIAVEADVVGLPLRPEPPAVGDTVYALGHPYGQATGGKLQDLLVWSASRGMVGGVGPWLVQTDTALNPGNSGGPLVDEQGRVIGIVSRKIAGEGIGFAARADRVQEMAAEPDMGPFLGGSWGLGAGFFQGERAEIGGNVVVVVRERLVARGWLGLGLGDAQPFGLLTLEARQRVGRGPLSTSFDLGGGVRWFDDTVSPLVSARVSLASVGFGAQLVHGAGDGPPEGWGWTLTLDVEWPGKLGVF